LNVTPFFLVLFLLLFEFLLGEGETLFLFLLLLLEFLLGEGDGENLLRVFLLLLEPLLGEGDPLLFFLFKLFLRPVFNNVLGAGNKILLGPGVLAGDSDSVGVLSGGGDGVTDSVGVLSGDGSGDGDGDGSGDGDGVCAS